MRWEQKNHDVALDIGLGLRKHFLGISVSSQTPRHFHSGLVWVSDWVLDSSQDYNCTMSTEPEIQLLPCCPVFVTPRDESWSQTPVVLVRMSLLILSRLDNGQTSAVVVAAAARGRVTNGSKFLLPNMSTAQTGCCNPSSQATVIMQISPLATLGAKSRFKRILKPKKRHQKSTRLAPSAVVLQMKAAVGGPVDTREPH